MKITIKKGLNLHLKGEVSSADKIIKVKPSQVAVCPDDFEGFIPKTLVRQGQKVAVGEPILFHKGNPKIKLVSPVAGTVSSIERGERRHINHIAIQCDENPYSEVVTHKIIDIPEAFLDLLAESGLLSFIRQRPYGIIPNIDILPRDIFVTAFDSAPLAVTRTWGAGDIAALQAGASILAKISLGSVYVSRRDDSFPILKDVENVIFNGAHPAGLPGVQAANIKPVNKGEVIWTLSAETMWRIGMLVLNGKFDPTTRVTLCGSEIKDPYIAETIIGSEIAPLLSDHLE